jgi:branched-chain amino acid aminotransferase
MIEIKKPAKTTKIKYDLNPAFGTIFTPHVLKLAISIDGKIQGGAEIIPLSQDAIPSSTAALHYGQSIFEGMKAYRQANGRVGVFRPDKNATRFKLSARRMAMGEVPEEVFLQCIKEYVQFEEINVPSEPGHSLYLRPLLFAGEPKIKVGPVKFYSFYIMSTIAGSYFSSGGTFKSARVLVNRDFVRATPNGMGETKTAANYAASIWPQAQAAKLDCDQVLYLDSTQHEYVDELGGMNFFFIRGKELVTPALNGCILHGVTRDSILKLAPSLGLTPVEEKVSFTQLCKDIESGRVQETFACGTAAVVSPIGEFVFQEGLNSTPKKITLKEEPKKSLEILKLLNAIQRGEVDTHKEWMHVY